MPRKILVIHGDPSIVRLVEINLQRAGYKVVTSASIEEGKERLEEGRPDLIVLDPYMTLPTDGPTPLKGPGITFVRDNYGSDNPIPMIPLTERAKLSDAFFMWQRGMDYYLCPPFNPMKLLTFVKRIFDSLR